jgi:pimeloyl-ACP methyl ester carboxylesterase
LAAFAPSAFHQHERQKMIAPERSEFYAAQDGLRLHARVTGTRNPAKLPVICLPGLSRNARDFSAIAQILATQTDREVVAFDYRGRGLSAYDKTWQNYNIIIEAGDVLAGMAALGIEHAHFIGTSRGGLILHVLAGMRPGAMKSVVLNDVGPEIGGAGMAQIKIALERQPKPASWDEATQMLKQANGKAFEALSHADFERMARAIFRTNEKGRIVADFDPALLNTIKAIDFTKPLPTLWPQFAGLKNHPMLVLRGENSQLLMAETLARMHSVVPKMQSIIVGGQGHVPLLETGDLPQKIISFFDGFSGAK